jgi:hypothetical protein
LQAVKESLIRVLWPLAGGSFDRQGWRLGNALSNREPLAGGGFDRQGWRLGNALSNRELAVEVARVEGVSEVAGLNLFTKNLSSSAWQPVNDSRNGVEQNVRLERWQLPELLAVTAVADDSATGAPLSILESSINPAADPNAVAVPVVPDLC